MSKNNKIRNYVLFTLGWSYTDKGYKWTPIYYSWNGLVHRIAQSEVYGNHPIIKNLSVDMNETFCRTNIEIGRLRGTGEEYIYTKCHRVYYICKLYNGKMYEVDYDKLSIDISMEYERLIRIKEKKAKAIAAEHRSNKYRFRRGPVPTIHNYNSCHRGDYYRIPKLGSVRRSSEIVEYKEFVKPKDRCVNLPVWDDRIRHNDKCWKTSYKVRKQWEKNLKHKDR